MQSSKATASFTLHGIVVSRGISIGRAHLITPAVLDARHYLIPQEKVESEVQRLEHAIRTVHQELETIWSNLPENAPVELGAFLDVHTMILSDAAISKEPLNIIRTRRYNAEWALLTQIDEVSAKFEGIADPYLRERKADIQQVAERVMKVLTGSASHISAFSGASVNTDDDNGRVDMVVIAYDISPTDLLEFRDHTFCGFVSELGGQNSHAAIVARSVDVPAVFGLPSALTLIEQDDWLIIDADNGVVIVNPPALVLQQYRARQLSQAKARKKLSKLRKMPAITLDEVPITLLANIEFPGDCAAAIENGASGVGLFRSEFLFMGRSGGVSKLPTEEEQFAAYKQTVIAMKGAPVTIRTLDIGADKQLGLHESSALNPALGLRAIRYCLAEPELFSTQLRAILRASAFGPVKLLIPMFVHAFEIDQALAMIEQAKADLTKSKKKFNKDIEIGAMIEVPAAVLALPMFTSRLDFLSIGTNDLIQYALAIDRVDPEVAHLYDPFHPAILTMLSMIIATGKKANIPVSICGEVAGDAGMIRLLLGMGLREFSMHPTRLLNVKQEILNTNIKQLMPHVRKIMNMVEPDEIQKEVQKIRELNTEQKVKAEIKLN